MAEKITHGMSVGGPITVHTEDGVIRRVRPLVLDDSDPEGWTLEARGKKFSPPRNTTVSLVALNERDRVYAYDRNKYPMIRVDFEETADGKNRNTQNRGKSGYRRATWEEALGLVAREIRRIQGKYGKEAVTAMTSSHHSWGLVGYKMSAFKRFFNMLGYTRVMDNPDSWEGFHWGAPHVYGYNWRLGSPENFDLLEDALQNVETLIMWSHDPDTTRSGYSTNESAIWRHWLKELGVQFIYIDPFNNFSSVKNGDKCLSPRMGTDAALAEAIAYVWLTEGTYDKEYVDKHVHRFDEWADHILGKGVDRTPKTPKWAEEITGVKAADIKAVARRWASTKTMGGSGSRGGYGGVCRTAGGVDFARIMIQLFAMQGMGKPGQNMWTACAGAPMDYNFSFAGYSDPTGSIASEPIADHAPVNDVEQVLYRTNLPEAVLDGHYEWYSDGFCGASIEQQFTEHVYPLPGKSKVHMFYRYGGSFFGSMLDTNKWARMYKSDELEFVVNQDIFFNPEARFADVIFPACTNLERNDIGEFSNTGNRGYQSHGQNAVNWQVVVFQEKAIEPLWESRSDYWIFSQLAERLGFGQQYTEGRTDMDWCKRFWEKTDLCKRISWEDFVKKGYYVVPVPENHERHYGFRWFAEGYPCDTPNHRPCQEEGKLGTLTGKFEFVSESILKYCPHDECRTPIATYKESWEGRTSLLRHKYPYALMSPHIRYDYHTHFQQHCKWLWEIPENRKVINGNPYQVIRMNPQLAAKKGIREGDLVRMFNDRGSVLGVARLTNRLTPETIHCYSSSGIYNPVVYGEITTDKGGCTNLLTPSRLMGEKVPGMAPNSCLIDIEKAELPEGWGQGFEKILEEVK